jgi:hypothetical protein
MILRRLLLDPAEKESGGAAPITPAPVAKTPVTSPSHAPKAARELTDTEKKVEFKVDNTDPIFSKDTSVKSSELKGEVKDVNAPAAPVLGEPAVKPPADKEPVKPKVAEPKVADPEPKSKPTIEPIVPKTTPVKEFDYTGYSEHEVQVLKQMSTSAKDFTIKLLKEKKDLEKHKDGQFMQHPNAYTLDPQYGKLQEDVYYYNKETEYWQEQLSKAKAGDTWQPLKGWTKDGQPVAGDPAPASASAEEQIRLMMNRCYTAVETKQNELKQFAGNYKQRLTTDTKAINEERAKRFGWVANPEILKAPVEIAPGLIKSVAEIREDLISLFPPYMQHTQGVEVAADLFAALQIYGQELREAKAGKQVAEVKAEEVARAEPTSKNGAVDSGRPTIGKVKEFSLAGLPL